MTELMLVMRWLHVFFAFVWVGTAYFMLFVYAPAKEELGKDSELCPLVMPRALAWVKWSSKLAFVLGLVLYALQYMYAPEVGFGPNALARSGRHLWIMIGMTLGTAMWFIVWFVVWPAQKLVLSGKAGDKACVLKSRAMGAMKAGAYLSGPTLLLMLGAAHYSLPGIMLPAAVFLGLAAIFAAFKLSARRKKV